MQTLFSIDMSSILATCSGLADFCGYGAVRMKFVEASVTKGLVGFLEVDLLSKAGTRCERVEELIDMLNDNLPAFNFGLHSTSDADIWLEFVTFQYE
jgi:hypothetical protein